MIITNFTNLTFLGTLTSEPIFKIFFPLYVKKKTLNYLEWVMIEKFPNTDIDKHQQASNGWMDKMTLANSFIYKHWKIGTLYFASLNIYILNLKWSHGDMPICLLFKIHGVNSLVVSSKNQEWRHSCGMSSSQGILSKSLKQTKYLAYASEKFR